MTIVGGVAGAVSMLQTVDSPDINVICICNNLRTLSCSSCSCWFLDNRGMASTSK